MLVSYLYLTRITSTALSISLLLSLALSQKSAFADDLWNWAIPQNQTSNSNNFSLYVADFDAEQQLVHVTSDAMPGYSDIKALVDTDSNLTHIQHSSNSGEPALYPIAQLNSGIVLVEAKGKEILTLKSEHFDPTQGGAVDMIYLHNGIKNTYRSFHMELVEKENFWILRAIENNQAREFTSMFLEKHTFFGKIIGIKTITVS